MRSSRNSQLLSSWFEQTYEYRIEEGDLRYSPSKIEAVRRDGGDFDDIHLQNLKGHLQSSAFPINTFSLYFETDDFRRFVRIYVDSAQNSHSKRKKYQAIRWSIIPMDEIQSRIVTAR
jgi:hypothetical protein